jgi:hypothetical protein
MTATALNRVMLGLAIACFGSQVAGQEGDAPLRLEVAGTVRFAADGKVTEFIPDPKVNAAVATQVANSVGRWQFAVPDATGQPVEGDTHARLALEAVPSGQGYGLRLTEAWFGAPTLAQGAPTPEYPRVLLEARAGARVLLQLQMDGKGGVAHAAVKDTGLLTHIKDEAIRAKWRERFGQASLEAAQRWTFVAGARQGGVATFPRDVLVLVTFWPRDVKGDTSYRHMGWPMATSPWATQNKTTLPPGTVLVDPRVLPLDSTPSFRTDVVGTLL